MKGYEVWSVPALGERRNKLEPVVECEHISFNVLVHKEQLQFYSVRVHLIITSLNLRDIPKSENMLGNKNKSPRGSDNVSNDK